MKKRIVSAVIALVLCATVVLAAIPAFAGGTAGLGASKTSACAGETFDVTLTLPAISQKLSTFQWQISFDKDNFEVTAFAPPAGSNRNYSTAAEANTNGKVSVSYMGEDGENTIDFSSGYTMTASFKVKTGATLGSYSFAVVKHTTVELASDGYTPIDHTPASYTDSVSVEITAAPVPATGISLNKKSTSIVAGSTETLTATVTPSASTDKVTWSSDNESVATVSSAGVVSAVATGTANITATAGSYSDTCAVTVTCNHSLSTVPEQTSTCKEQGWDAYKECSKCHKLFATDGTTELSAIPYRALADHSYGAWIALVPSTHDADGVLGHYHCPVCGKDFDISKNELSSLTITKDADHGTPATAWSTDATYHWHVCKVADCNVVIESTKAEHTFEWKTDTAATEDAAGVKHEECSVCGYKRNENTPIPKLDHTHVGITHHDAVTATCKSTGNIEYWTCASTKCSGKYYSDELCQNEITTGIVTSKDSTNHVGGTEFRNAKPATCYAKGYEGDIYCLGCGDKIGTGEDIDMLDHTPSTWKTDATYHWKECTVAACGAEISGSKAEHTFEWKVDTVATEDAAGVKHEECSVCGYKRNENTPIPKLDHTHTGITHHDAVPGSCKAEGNIEYWTCSSPKCAGKFYSEETCTVTVENITVPKDENNHIHTEIRDKKDATCTEDGYTGDTYCTDCGKKLADGETVKATGHSYEKGKCKTCGAKDPNSKDNSPKLGDESNLLFWLILALVSCIAVLGLTFEISKRPAK